MGGARLKVGTYVGGARLNVGGSGLKVGGAGLSWVGQVTTEGVGV